MSRIVEKPSCHETRVEVSRSDLPLSCPMPEQSLWNAHPQVYLPIDKAEEVSCPYCGTVYVIAD